MRQIGWLGASDALRTFDPERGVKFTVFARHRIQGAISDYFRELFKSRRKNQRPNQVSVLEAVYPISSRQSDNLDAQIDYLHALNQIPYDSKEDVEKIEYEDSCNQILERIMTCRMLDNGMGFKRARTQLRHAVELRMGGLSLKVAGQVMNLSESRVCHIIQKLEKIWLHITNGCCEEI